MNRDYNFIRHYEPLRPNRYYGVEDKYEFTHGQESVCVYDIKTFDYIKEISVGKRPDCHCTSVNNKYLYIACEDGLWCIDQGSLEVVKKLDTGHVYGTNAMPDGNTMLLHDAYGGILVIKDIQDMNNIHIYKRLNILEKDIFLYTLGGKGHFLGNGRYYLCCGWESSKIFIIDIVDNYSFDVFMDADTRLYRSDDLVISRDKTKLYAACYGNKGHVAVIDVKTRGIISVIPCGGGTCGLTMSNDERYVIASNDRDDSITIIDSLTDKPAISMTVREGFKSLGLKGTIQGISVGQGNEIYVYDCSGSGALVCFDGLPKRNPDIPSLQPTSMDITSIDDFRSRWTVSCSTGKSSSE